MFSIRVLTNQLRDAAGACLGEITVGGFTERFACHPVSGAVEDLDQAWCRELRKLVGGQSSVALVHDRRFAWVFYREGSRCVIQQVFARTGDFREHLERRTSLTEDGDAVSEWIADVSAIETFLRGNHEAAV